MRNTPSASPLLDEILDALTSITDVDITTKFGQAATRAGKGPKSISAALNVLIREKLGPTWGAESPIFQDAAYSSKKDRAWRLDFAKGDVSVEVAFNHGEAIAWNLLKPVLAGELNHVKKARQTRFGVIVCATAELKAAGNLDGAVGEYEKILRYLTPLHGILTVPLLVIGLCAPKTFYIDATRRRVVALTQPDTI